MGNDISSVLARHTKIKKDFIREFAQSLNFIAACEKIGACHDVVQKLLTRDSDFSEAKALCENRILDNIESRVYADAEKDDNKLAMFLLRTRRRDKYGNDNSAQQNVQVNVQVNLSEVE